MQPEMILTTGGEDVESPWERYVAIARRRSNIRMNDEIAGLDSDSDKRHAGERALQWFSGINADAGTGLHSSSAMSILLCNE